MTTELKAEYQVNSNERQQVNKILEQCFPEYYVNREYFKQIPHFRIFIKEEDTIIGKLAIDYRIMSLNDQPIRVWGIIDVCVLPEKRGHNLSSILLKKAEKVATENGLDFLLLFADNPKLYLNNGYVKCLENEIHWLKINEHEMLGLGKEVIPELMIKKIGNKEWEAGKLDMMGYLY
jgi:predicted acetyltransferase